MPLPPPRVPPLPCPFTLLLSRTSVPTISQSATSSRLATRPPATMSAALTTRRSHTASLSTWSSPLGLRPATSRSGTLSPRRPPSMLRSSAVSPPVPTSARWSTAPRSTLVATTS
ncbi:hypothetical protein ATCV1_z150L [Acanthocystis turfacea chlorella virus 1]|uniref:Uncharacterized protein z150L n=1 Tax=Chlorovirus heliozoae TaxID=322019 RepID=A7K8B0_9PHYC|nr:hypothetical protein ATCV1_z150L [Acanthocystis turfacea chlorella virus 1]ABT16284.1 hypothetical protein ATCV1_z150L [Acanthocystis turfacea chlorella virus 1]